MTLTWSEIDARWPDAGVMWDRDVAPTLVWEPRFRAYGHNLWADDPECEQRGYGRCRCLLWIGNSWSTIAHYATSPTARERRRLLLREDRPNPSWRDQVAEHCARLIDRGPYDQSAWAVTNEQFDAMLGEYHEPDRFRHHDVDRVARRIAGRILAAEERIVPPQFR